MTRQVAGLMATLTFLVGPETAIAQQPPPGVPTPGFRASAQAHRLDDGPAAFISASGDGCYDATEAAIDPTSPWSIDNYSCIAMSLHLTRNGRTVAVNQREFHDVNGDTPGNAGMFISWNCQRTGTFRWRVTYTNGSVPGFTADQPYSASEQGAFRVPRCIRELGRYVDRGTAAARALQVNQDFYEGEFISSVRCTASGPRRGARSTAWTCRTTHNNTIRECVDRERLRFIGRDAFGNHVRDVRVSSQGKRCRFF
jgi:hypothetical protein